MYNPSPNWRTFTIKDIVCYTVMDQQQIENENTPQYNPQHKHFYNNSMTQNNNTNSNASNHHNGVSVAHSEMSKDDSSDVIVDGVPVVLPHGIKDILFALLNGQSSQIEKKEENTVKRHVRTIMNKVQNNGLWAKQDNVASEL